MKTNFTKLTLIALLSAAGTTLAFAEANDNWPTPTSQTTRQATANAPKLSAPTIAIASADVKQVLNLKDGSSVYVFNDGKMAMETRYGHAQRMDPGMAMETANGQKITMNGDEVARLDSLLNRVYGRGN
jgi:hypothetical protein